ncbi:hypothetical protein KIPB_005780 [Kipferlia bialata]|uniref:Armadillo-like helical n=1 Tax=Kipferlia bialata TaxID=797122 RepID=A0A9K3GHM6_9EUKA|nr:hypothetical protein KIPB_005780 [Kipferlia bialata]|eukprot:g5780.t1
MSCGCGCGEGGECSPCVLCTNGTKGALGDKAAAKRVKRWIQTGDDRPPVQDFQAAGPSLLIEVKAHLFFMENLSKGLVLRQTGVDIPMSMTNYECWMMQYMARGHECQCDSDAHCERLDREDTRIRRVLVKAGIVQLTVQLLEQYRDDTSPESVVPHILVILDALASDSQGFPPQVTTGIGAVFYKHFQHILSTHKSRIGTIEALCNLIRPIHMHLQQTDPKLNAGVCMLVRKALIESMAKNMGSPRLLAVLLRGMVQADFTADRYAACHKQRLHLVVLKILSRHPSVTSIVHTCLGILGNLTDGEDARVTQMLCKAGAVERARAALLAQKGHEGVAFNAWRVLRGMAVTEENRPVLVSAGVHKWAIKALETYPTTVGVVFRATTCLEMLTRTERQCDDYLATSRCVCTLIPIVSAYKRVGKDVVLPALYGVLFELSRNNARYTLIEKEVNRYLKNDNCAAVRNILTVIANK